MNDPGLSARREDWEASGLSSVVRSRLPVIYAQTGRYDRLFAFARSAELLQQQADDAARPGSSRKLLGPLGTLDLALTHAIALNRIPDMAGFTLSRALWEARLNRQAPLAALRLGADVPGGSLVDRSDAERATLWRLLLAWDQADAGNPGLARTTLQELSTATSPMLGSAASGRAVILLFHVGNIDEHRLFEFHTLLDPNDLPDLCRMLIAAGRFDQAFVVSESMTLWHDHQISVLADLARAAVASGRSDIARDAVARARSCLSNVEHRDVAESLARIAGAQAAVGDAVAATASFRDALAWCERLDDPQSALQTIAHEQDAAGLIAAAAKTVGLMTDTHQRLEALEEHAVAVAVAGAFAEAAQILDRIGDSEIFIFRRRGVRDVAAEYAAQGDVEGATQLVADLLEPSQRDVPYAALIPIAARHGRLERARELAATIKDPYWRARAMVTAAKAVASLTDLAWVAIAEVADPGQQAMLFAEHAMNRDGGERSRMYDQVIDRAYAVSGDDRWRTLTEVGITIAGAGMAAAELFAEARRALLDDTDDTWEEGRDLWELGRIQSEHGDAAGARETFATVLSGGDQRTGQRFAALSLFGIAVGQSRAGDEAGARETLQAAARTTSLLPDDDRAQLEPLVVRALVETGAVKQPARLVYQLLGRIGSAGDNRLAAATSAASAALPIAQWLTAVGQPNQARQVLADVGQRTGPLLGSSMATSQVLAGLGQAMADVGDVGGATATIADDESGMWSGHTLASVAVRQAHNGDFATAFATMRNIGQPTMLVDGYCELAHVLRERGEQAYAAQALREAVSVAAGQPRANEAAQLLVRIGMAERKAGQLNAAASYLEHAQRKASDVERDETRHYVLSLVAKEQAAGGDITAALATSEAIMHLALRGEAKLWAAIYAPMVNDGSLQSAIDIIKTIDSPYWRAAGLLLVSAGQRLLAEDPTETYAEAQTLLNGVPEGEARTRLLEILVDTSLATGDHQQAVTWTQQMTASRPEHVIKLAAILLHRRDSTAVGSLLPVAAKHVESAFLLCPMLAGLYPEHSAAIAAEVASANAPPADDGPTAWSVADSFDGDDDPYSAQTSDGDLEGGDEEDVHARDDPLEGTPLTEVVETALRHAASNWYLGDLVDTRDVLRSLMAADNSGDWTRISLHFRDSSTIMVVSAADSHHQPGGDWGGAILTASCIEALRIAAQIARGGDLIPMPAGVLALGLIADPRSAAAQGMGVTNSQEHTMLVRLIQEDLLNVDLF